MNPEPSAGLFDTPSARELTEDAVWWTIYDASFPSSEREAPAVILRSVETGVGVAIRLRLGAETAGLATIHLLRDPPAVMLVYLALAPELRGRGLGGALFEQVWDLGAARQRDRQPHSLGLIWEVDIPAQGTTPEEIRRRERRIEFFARHGGHVLPQPYRQPPVNGIDSVSMHLMYRPAGDTGLPAPATAEALIRAMYYEKYGATNGIPRITLEALLRDLRRGSAIPPGTDPTIRAR